MLKPGDLVAVCGDSITEQHIYSVDIEDYLVMCQPQQKLRAEQFGWGGETSWGFHDKMNQFMLPFGATVATTCYGMNDGGYRPLTDDTAKKYREHQLAIIEKMRKAGVHSIVVGTPGAVDFDTFHHDPKAADMYNKTLASLGDIDREIAAQQGLPFADVHGAMVTAMTKAKAKYGHKYVFAGGDGIHPGPNGHLVMAYAYLKAMGVDGNVGKINVDLAANKADASEGHKVLSVNSGSVEIESARYPFCFYGDPASSDATAGIIEFCPFNQDLNRFTLVVTNPGADKVKVTFGKETKEFSATDLAGGINLAALFLNNPFSQPFAAVQEKIRQKQGIETLLIKNYYNSIPAFEQSFPDAKPAYEASQAPIREVISATASSIPTLVTPVRYVIKIEAVK